MDCILLAAGYATRLYPLTENMPKALLKLGSKTILDRVCEKIEELDEINNIYIVTNHRFAQQFEDWAKTYNGKKSVKVLDDGTTNNDNRLGAIGDIKFVLDSENITDEILVMASDNVFDFSLQDMMNLYHEKNTDVISAHYVPDLVDLRQMGVLELDGDNRVISFVEKPAEPKSHWGVPPFYFYKKETVALIQQYLAEGNNPDAPGHLIPWLIERTPVYAYTFDVMTIDIGTPKTYAEAQKLFD
ncbi:MAG: nucleotidyltransferase family protein [Clostridia bacterium]|nr:nucleotidyltransferase family protein [Clostridia bacterium]